MRSSETANYIEFHHETSSLIAGDVRSRTKGQILLLSNREPAVYWRTQEVRRGVCKSNLRVISVLVLITEVFLHG